MTAWNTKKVESTNLRSHGICVVGRLPKDTDDLGKRFPCTERITLAGSRLARTKSAMRAPSKEQKKI
jgi:hypothetical protein